MMQECNVIAKGSYSQFRFNEFISVRQYLLIREEGKKYLLLKLSNDASETVTGLKLVIEQIDVRGACIEKSRIEWTDVNGEPGERFIAKDKIPLRENCMEVKIHLVGATFGEYTYAVKSNELVVTYDKKQPQDTQDYSSRTRGEKAVAYERRFKLPKVLAILSMLVLICSFAFTFKQLSLFKDTETAFRWDDVRYEFIDGNKEEGAPIRITQYLGHQENVVIPKEIKGYPITEIASGVFRDQDTLQTIDIRAEVSLEYEAFAECDNLREVKLTGVTSVGERAFANCYGLTKVTAGNLDFIGSSAFMSCTSLSTLEISHAEKTLQLGSGVFYHCGELQNITIDQVMSYPAGERVFSSSSKVQNLYLRHYNSALYEESTDKTLSYLFGNQALYYLRSVTIRDIDEMPNFFCQEMPILQSVVLEGFESDQIPYKAFYNCGNLSDFKLSFEGEVQHITEVGDYAFCGTSIPSFDGSALERIGAYAFAGNGFLTDVGLSQNEALRELNRSAFKNCSALKTIHISSLIEVLPESVFENCVSLTVVTFTDAGVMKEIQSSAMRGCSSMTYIKVPSSVSSIGDYAFEGCSAATTCMLSRSVETIGDFAFANCASIQNVEIPKGITKIGNGAFYGCYSLTSIALPFVGRTQTEETYLASIFGGSSYGDYSYVPSALTEVTITGNTEISRGAFYGIQSLKRVYLKGEIPTIGAEAFAYCTNLREVSLSSALSQIDQNAFLNCYLLFEVWNSSALDIQRGNTDMGGIAEYALAVYNRGDERLDYCEVNGFSFLCAEEGWYVTDYLAESPHWTLPDTILNQYGSKIYAYTMPSHLFARRLDVETLTVEDGVTAISSFSFEGCTNLKEVTASTASKLLDVQQSAFSGCVQLKKVALPDGVQQIGNNAFLNCNVLQSINMPKELLEVGDAAFRYCKRLTSLTFGEKVQRIGKNALGKTNSLQSLTLPFIGETATQNQYLGYIFGVDYQTGLESDGIAFNLTVLLPCDVIDYAFYNLNNLKSVYFKSHVDTIGVSAFENCGALESVELTDGVRQIENFAFAYSALQNISLHYGLERIGDSAFCSTNVKQVSLPTSLWSMGTEAFAYSSVEQVAMRYVMLTEIPARAFKGCENLHTVDAEGALLYRIAEGAFLSSGLTSFSFPEGVSTIGEQAFFDTRLQEITLPSDLIEMGQYAFASSMYLQKVEIPASGLTELPSFAFANCYKLAEVSLPFGLQRVGSYAFQSCEALEEVALPETVEAIDYCAFGYCYALECVWLSESLSYIEENAFSDCWSLQEVYNPSPLYVERGDSNHGGVAKNALIVHTSLYAQRMTTERVKGLVYKCAPTEKIACIYQYESLPKELAFTTLAVRGVTYEYYWIYNNLFAGSNLEVVDTGVVNEIDDYAFAYSSNLRKVTLGASLDYGKVADSAFAGCQALWEVHNNSVYSVDCGSWECGQVAYYALVINEEIQYKQKNSFKWLSYQGDWYLYEYSGYGDTVLADIGTDYFLFRHPMLGNYPFQNVYYSYLIVPTYVIGASDNVFGSNRITIYYEGTQAAWQSIFANATSNYLTVYYYNDCVHNFYYGTEYWRYDSRKAPTTADSALREQVTPATCQSEGLVQGVCDTCGACLWQEVLPIIAHNPVENVYQATCRTEGLIETFCGGCGIHLDSEYFPKVAHDYSGANGACVWCQQKLATEDCLGDLAKVENLSDVGFMVSTSAGKTTLYNDWREDYGTFDTELKIEVQARVVLTLQLETVLPKTATLTVLINDEEYLVCSKDYKEEIEIELQVGESISFFLTLEEEDVEARIYLKEVTVRELPPLEKE